MRLYVGNLPYSYSEEDLKTLFANYNTSSVKLVIDRETNRSKGFGFVDIDSTDEAQNAIKALDKQVVDGKTLVINEARPLQKREGGGGGRDSRDSREGGGAGRPFNRAPRRFGRE